MNYKKFLLKKGYGLDTETEARYLCLLEGLEFIDKKLNELGYVDEQLETPRVANKVDKALINYINERYYAMLNDLKIEKKRRGEP